MKLKILSALLLSILIFTSCSKDDENTENPKANLVTIESFTDIEFTLLEIEEGAKTFSTTTGKQYEHDNITTEIAQQIDIVSFSNTSFIAFISPSESNIPSLKNAPVTKFQHTNIPITNIDFEAITDHTSLTELSIINDNDSVAINNSEGKLILFENAAGKKGAIKIKAINAQRILVDIKVQK